MNDFVLSLAGRSIEEAIDITAHEVLECIIGVRDASKILSGLLIEGSICKDLLRKVEERSLREVLFTQTMLNGDTNGAGIIKSKLGLARDDRLSAEQYNWVAKASAQEVIRFVFDKYSQLIDFYSELELQILESCNFSDEQESIYGIIYVAKRRLSELTVGEVREFLVARSQDTKSL